MNAKHTPGPWTVIVNGDGGNFAIVPEKHKSHPENWTITTIREWQKEDRDNATLIAAAPELLEAMKGCLIDMQIFYSKHRDPEDRHFKAFKDAIAKAEGRE